MFSYFSAIVANEDGNCDLSESVHFDLKQNIYIN